LKSQIGPLRFSGPETLAPAVLVRLRKKNRKTAEIQREREMADKIEKEFDRNEFADYLADLAEQIQGGRLASDRGAWTVPEGEKGAARPEAQLSLVHSC
jgi:hypothetical protein